MFQTTIFLSDTEITVAQILGPIMVLAGVIGVLMWVFGIIPFNSAEGKHRRPVNDDPHDPDDPDDNGDADSDADDDAWVYELHQMNNAVHELAHPERPHDEPVSIAGYLRGLHKILEQTSSTAIADEYLDAETGAYLEADAPYNYLTTVPGTQIVLKSDGSIKFREEDGQEYDPDMPITGHEWIDVHWAHYGSAWYAESLDYHDRMEWERREFRRECGLAA